MDGWIKLYRQFSEWEWYTDSNTMRVFVHILINANINTTKYRGFELKKGQLITTIPELAKALKLSEQNVRTSIKHLQKTNEISVKVTNKFSLITVEKYGFFQDNNVQANSQLTDNQQASNSQVTGNQQATNSQLTRLIKEHKNIRTKEVNNNNIEELLLFSKKLSTVVTEPTTEEQIKRLFDESGGNAELVISKYKLAKDQGNIKNIIGFIISAIRNNYTASTGMAKKSRFNNFTGRVWDTEKLEKMEREYIKRELELNK